MAYGLRPLSGAIGLPGPRRYPVADGYTGNIFSGDFVERLADGTIQRQNLTIGESPVGATPTVGVAYGFQWVDSAGVAQWGQYYPGSSANTKIYAYVFEDPNQLFLIQSNGNTTLADVGDNASVAGVAASAGSTATGNSGIYLDHSSIAQTALTLRIVKVIENGSNEYLTSNKDVVVQILPAAHQNVLSDQIP